VRGAQAGSRAAAVFEREHDAVYGCVTFPAPGFLPQLARLQRRHQQFNRPGGFHFFADDLRQIRQHAMEQRQVDINARGKLLDVPSA
jgi:hypothetical protein